MIMPVWKLQKLEPNAAAWAELETQWRAQCAEFDEDFEDYYFVSLNMLRSLGAFGLVDDDGTFHGVMSLDRVEQKGYTGTVLRALYFFIAPKYDFGELEIADYTNILTQYLVNVIDCSNDMLVSDHIKVHYRSRSDAQFYEALAPHLNASSKFSSVTSRGMWLYIEKVKTSV
jgi:hypothetical protein